MKLTIQIDMGNAAFEDNGRVQEVSTILAKFLGHSTHSSVLLDEPGEWKLHDTNGNTVGFAKVTDE